LALTRQGNDWPDALKRSIGLIIKDPEDMAAVQAAGVI